MKKLFEKKNLNMIHLKPMYKQKKILNQIWKN